MVQRHRSVLTLSLLALLCSSCKGSDAAKPEAPEVAVSAARESGSKPNSSGRRRVEVAVLKNSDAALRLRLPGEVEGSKDASLAAPLGGFIESISVKAGDDVKKGQILARVDTATHSARLSQAKVEVDAARRELERTKALADAVPKAELDAAQTRLDAAKAALYTQQVNVGRSLIRAPFAGTVAQVEAEAGEVASPGAPLLRLVQLDPAKVSISVPGRDVVTIDEGMAARVSVDASGKIHTGKVARVEPAADPKTRSFIVEVEVPNPAHEVLPGMIASVELVSEVAKQQLVVSQDWLVTGLKEVGVFVEVGGKAVWRPVELGQIVRNRVVVEKGLKLGDRLVITGHRELKPGDALLIARAGICCSDGRVAFE